MRSTRLLGVATAGVLLSSASAVAADGDDARWAQSFMDQLLDPWALFGFAAQFTFMMRFVVQWISSERRKRSYVPVAFWYLSLVGGLMLFVYAVRIHNPVFMFGQGLGCFIYVRNLLLIHRRAWARRELLAERAAHHGANAAVRDVEPAAAG